MGLLNLNGDMCVDSDETGTFESLDSDESSLPIEAASPPMVTCYYPHGNSLFTPPEGINPVLPEETLINSPGTAATKNNPDSSQKPLTSPLCF